MIAINESVLQWASIGDSSENVVISGESDVSILRNLKNVLLGLQREFNQGGSKVVISG